MAKFVLLLVFVCFQFSRSEELPAIEQVKLDINEEIPISSHEEPHPEVLDGADNEQGYPGPKFNYDWLNEKLPQGDETALNSTGSDALSDLEKLIKELNELIAELKETQDSLEWDLYDEDDWMYDEDYSSWSSEEDWDYVSQGLEAVINTNGNVYKYNTVASLKHKNSNDDKIGQNLSSGKIPVKRFTSV